MARPSLLTDAELAAALGGLPGWERAGDEIVRTFECASFPDAIAFVVRIGFFAERADHHPDSTSVGARCAPRSTTHDAGGLTAPRHRARARDLAARSRRRSRADMPLAIAIGIILVLLVRDVGRVRQGTRPRARRRRDRLRRRVGSARFQPAVRPLGRRAPRRPAPRAVRRREAGGVREHGEPRASWARASPSTTSSPPQQTAIVATRVSTDEGMVQNRVVLEKRANGWMVVGYSIRTA